jgi:hypothetical protein
MIEKFVAVSNEKIQVIAAWIARESFSLIQNLAGATD